jgi:hypothetical protein
MGVRFVFRPFRVMVAIGLVAVGLCWVGAAGASSEGCQTWGAQPPDEGSSTNQLQGVAATSACNAWAVGYYYDGSDVEQTLIEHWNGKAWSVQPSANPGGSSNYNELDGVIANSPTEVWAVGYYEDGTGADQTLIEHWNGKTWKVQPSPNPGGSSKYNALDSVAATSATDAWAVGGYATHSTEKALIEHWNGKTWTVQHSPTPGGLALANGRLIMMGPAIGLTGVVASSPKAALAVGFHYNGTSRRTLIERWNGKAWRVQHSPNSGGYDSDNELRGVSSVSPTDAWAVGNYATPTNQRTLVEHYNGKGWKVQPSPSPGGSSVSNGLEGVAAPSPIDAWAVGFTSNGNDALIEHWDGKAWKVQPSPNLGTTFLSGIAAVSSSDAWAVGSYEPDSTEEALAIHCC